MDLLFEIARLFRIALERAGEPGDRRGELAARLAVELFDLVFQAPLVRPLADFLRERERKVRARACGYAKLIGNNGGYHAERTIRRDQRRGP
ncbi:MAG: hypothetical protein RIC51_12575 [Erythrobacter sp.]